MNLLILGGTIFLGRHVAEAAVARGHRVTLFHRGEHPAEARPGVEVLRGDRDGDLAALRGRTWDAAVDTSAYFPDWVEASAGLLAPSVGTYCFVSSVSVYSDFSREGMTEQSAVSRLSPEQLDQARQIRAQGPVRAAALGELYGGLKVLCEDAAERACPGRTLVVRPGLIVGPYDYSNRFTYWVRRVADGGEVLAPGEPRRQVQFVDVRDLAEWMVRLLEDGRTGKLQVTGPAGRLGMGDLLEECRQAVGSGATFTWVPDAFLKQAGVGAWIEMPLWMEPDPADAGFMSLDCGRALARGLRFRPLADTVRDTLAWDRALPEGTERRAGLSREREAGLLAAWKAQAGPAGAESR
jgi:2'-hydroxyisoflavone reductase